MDKETGKSSSDRSNQALEDCNIKANEIHKLQGQLKEENALLFQNKLELLKVKVLEVIWDIRDQLRDVSDGKFWELIFMDYLSDLEDFTEKEFELRKRKWVEVVNRIWSQSCNRFILSITNWELDSLPWKRLISQFLRLRALINTTEKNRISMSWQQYQYLDSTSMQIVNGNLTDDQIAELNHIGKIPNDDKMWDDIRLEEKLNDIDLWLREEEYNRYRELLNKWFDPSGSKDKIDKSKLTEEEIVELDYLSSFRELLKEIHEWKKDMNGGQNIHNGQTIDNMPVVEKEEIFVPNEELLSE